MKESRNRKYAEIGGQNLVKHIMRKKSRLKDRKKPSKQVTQSQAK